MKIPTQLRHRLGGLTGPNQISSMRVTSIFALIPFSLQTNVLYAIIFNTCITFTDLRTGSFHLAPISEEQYHHKQDSNGSVRSGIFLFLLGSVTRAMSVVRSPYMCCSCFCVPSRLPFFIFIRRDFTAAV